MLEDQRKSETQSSEDETEELTWENFLNTYNMGCIELDEDVFKLLTSSKCSKYVSASAPTGASDSNGPAWRQVNVLEAK